ncbi:MAG: DUF5615 family PIN-like protein [Burkholderiales bacterium]
MKRLLLDQGLPRSTGTILAGAEWDIVHVAELGMSQAEDSVILERARAEQRICVTLDADFHALLATSGETSPSVLRIRKEGLDAAAVARLITEIWSRVERDLSQGAMVTVTDQSVRIRRLPIIKD